MPAQKPTEPSAPADFASGGGQAPSFGDDIQPEEPNAGGDEQGSDMSFEKEPFDAGVQADEDSDPKHYIQQLAGKLGTTIRKYTEDAGEPDLELEKFAINSVVSATHTSQMGSQDQKEIIKKIETAGRGDVTDAGDADNTTDTGGEEPTDDTGFGDEKSDANEPAPDDDVETENVIVDEFNAENEIEDPMDTMYVEYMGERQGEPEFIITTPNGKEKFQIVNAKYPNGKTDIAVYAFRGDVTYGYKWFRKAYLRQNEEVDNEPIVTEYEENIAENLPIGENYSTFVKKVIMEKLNKELFLTEMVDEVFGVTNVAEPDTEVETPVKEPDTKTKEPDGEPTRKDKPWRVPIIQPNPDPKASA